MHPFESAGRRLLSAAVRNVVRLPRKLSTPAAQLLTEIPTLIASESGLAATTSYWEPGLADNFGAYAPKFSIGILIQGPISTKSTLAQVIETATQYRRLFGDINLVVSTWRSSEGLIKNSTLSDLADVVFSEDPGPSFPTNLNRQTVSTYAGLCRLKEKGVEYALKTRTDHRVTSSQALAYLEYLWTRQPNDIRIVVSSYGSGKFRLYGWTEQLQFAKIDALIKFWTGNPIETMHNVALADQQASRLAKLGLAVHETRMNVRYLNSLGIEAKWTWPDNLQILNAVFGIADSHTLKHVQLGRHTSVLDHVYPWNSPGVNKIEQHTSAADWLLSLAEYVDASSPSHEELTAAMKVPSSDLTKLNALFVEAGAKETSNVPD